MNMAVKLRRSLERLSLSRTARAVIDDRLTYLRVEKLRRIERSLARVRAVPGDFVEFGVALGGSAIVIAGRAQGRSFHGFDLFAMIPPPASDKDDDKSRSRYEAIRSGASHGIGGDRYYGYREDLFGDVVAAFARHGLPIDQQSRHLHKGLFEESWPKTNIARVAFAHVDCDWYDPVRFCLSSLASRMSEGGLIVIDDYHDYGGCRTAVDEFLADNPTFALEQGPNPILRRERRE